MNTADIICLKNTLGEAEARKYLKADEEKIKILVKILKKTSVKRILDTDIFNEFCNKIIFGKYGKIYADVLCDIGKFNIGTRIPIKYQLFLINYINYGYNNEKKYKALFKDIEKFNEISSTSFDYEFTRILVEHEIKNTNKDKITIHEFLRSGGSLEELIDIMSKCEIKDFNLDTKIPVNDLKTINQEKFEASISQINYLVMKLPTLNMGKKTKIELLEVYYQEIVQKSQNNNQTDILILQNKPNLYKYLKRNGFIANILEVEKENPKKLEKVPK